MASPPDGYRRVSWAQLRAADQAIYAYVAVRCEAGTRARTGQGITEVERHFREGMKSPEILQFLAFLQGTDSQQTQGLKRSLGMGEEDQGSKRAPHNRRRGRAADAPPHWGGLPITTPAPECKRFCFPFNDHGCTLAEPGQECRKGKHVCPNCLGPHSIRDCHA